MEYRLVHDFKHNDTLRESFNDLTRTVYGFDFADWYGGGHWSDIYVCYAYAVGNTIVANVSATSLDFVIDGEQKRGVQIGTVMTHPDYRGQGLAGKLMEHVIAHYEKHCDFMFLFADKTVLAFYPKYGFSRIEQSTFQYQPQGHAQDRREVSPAPDMRQLSMTDEEDLKTVKRLTESRRPISPIFGVTQDQGLLMFYLTRSFSKDIYYLPGEDIAVVMRLKGDELSVYDILSQKPFVQAEVLQKIVSSDVRSVKLLFTPDGSIDSIEEGEWQSEDGLFIRPKSFAMPRSFAFPELSQA